MKATELMIGDWVYNSYHKKNIKWNYSEMFCPNGIPVIGRDLEPIPLTTEILEKNGWEHNGSFMDKRTDENTFFSWSDKFGAELYQNNYYMCYCKYVHTLQHALRLCGFDELADNFKV